jgi:2,3-bisphosphoglycerate-independent phosphoglycerate mutase
MNKKVMLMILDGWGIGSNPKVSAIAQAKTEFIDSLYKDYPHSKLEASGLAVGLPEGQMGNSEVGHMNLGAGRVVYQDLVKINLSVKDKTLGKEVVLEDAIQYAKTNNKKVHLLGLVSDGGVHAHIEHLKALCDIFKENGLSQVFIHAFTDGRDTDPKGGLAYIADLENHLKTSAGKIATVIGRYYAMDRDNRWERVKLAYDLMVKGEGKKYKSATEAISASYAADPRGDEFILPAIITGADDKPLALIEEGDVVLCFNYRTDRGREITLALNQKDFPEQGMKKLNLYYVTMTNYDDSFTGVKVIFDKDNLKNTLGEVLEAAGKKQIRIAETEKYPHVTFFFSGGREKEFVGEKRLLCPSPKVATYDMQPEMSAMDIRDKIIPELKNHWPDFVVLNFANPDMVGHTGVFEAAVKACEVVNDCAQAVITAGLENGYTFIVIADHGNADVMINEDGTPNTAHTTNLVPCILIDKEYKKPIKNGKLGDISPTILELMGVSKPAEMTGVSLL